MFQEGPTLGEDMSNTRADDLVLAGSAPSASTAQDPIAHVHRGTSFIVLVDAGIVVYLLATILIATSFISQTTSTTIIIAAVIVALSIYSGYRQRRQWAYWPAVGLLVTASLMFGFLAFLNLLAVLIDESLSSLLFVFLMGWAAFGSGRRALFHWHPVYRSGYSNDSFNPLADLEEGEMLAACPSCLAVLAIRPLMLGNNDRCPHCSSLLVNERLYGKYQGEDGLNTASESQLNDNLSLGHEEE
tara:strand:+ start:10765 stop:11496 length:732 start_codon:yes stop_codon:yes gene_type:complete